MICLITTEIINYTTFPNLKSGPAQRQLQSVLFFGGQSSSGGGSIYQRGGQNWEKGVFRGAEGAAKNFWAPFLIQKFLSTFFEIFGNLLVKMR